MFDGIVMRAVNIIKNYFNFAIRNYISFCIRTQFAVHIDCFSINMFQRNYTLGLCFDIYYSTQSEYSMKTVIYPQFKAILLVFNIRGYERKSWRSGIIVKIYL
jgi:hypothetical protein